MSVTHNPNVVLDGMDFYIDFANPKCYNPNMFPNPTDLFAWFGPGGAINATISRDTTTVSPVGNSPLLMTQTGGNDPYTHAWNTLQYSFGDVAVGDYVAWTMWAKADAPCTIKHYTFAANSSGAWLNDGQVWVFGTSTPTITTEWTRLTYINQITNPLSTKVQARLDGEWGTATTGRKIWFDGLNVTKISAVAAPPFYDKLGNLTTANSCIGNAYNATLSSLVRHHPTGYAVFTGDQDNSYLTVNGMNNIPATWNESATYELWLRRRSGGTWDNGYRAGIFSKGTTQGSIGLMKETGDGAVGMWIRDDSGGLSPEVVIAPETWSLLTGLWDGPNRVLGLYLNGVEIYRVAQTARVGIVDSDIYTIGGKGGSLSGTYGLAFRGDIAIARKYNRALSANEVMQNFNAQRGRFGV